MNHRKHRKAQKEDKSSKMKFDILLHYSVCFSVSVLSVVVKKGGLNE